MPTFTETLSSTFTGADEATLSEGGAWATLTGEASFSRTSNQALPFGSGTDSTNRHTTAVAAGQYSRADLTCVGTTGSAAGIGLAVRCASAARTYYRLAIDHAATNNAEIARFVAGTYTSLVQWTQAFTNGDQFTIAIENQVLYVYDKTLTQVQTFDDTGGGGPTTGSVGLSFSSIETSALLDNWSGGTFSTAAGGPGTLMLLGVGGMVRLMAAARLTQDHTRRDWFKTLLACFLGGRK